MIKLNQGPHWAESRATLFDQENVSKHLQSTHNAPTLLFRKLLALLLSLHHIYLLGPFHLFSTFFGSSLFELDLCLTWRFGEEKLKCKKEITLFELIARDSTFIKSQQLCNACEKPSDVGQRI